MGLAPETLRRTNLGLLTSGRFNLKIDYVQYLLSMYVFMYVCMNVCMYLCMYLSKVNIERALRADGRNSGHFVQVNNKNKH